MNLEQYVQRCFENVVRGPEDRHDYQLMAEQFVVDHPHCALFIDLGLGKTVISLSVIMRLISMCEMNYVLVIAPVRVCNDTWPTEIGLWRHTAPLSFVHVRHEDVVVAVNQAGQRVRNETKAEVEDACHWSAVNKSSTKLKVTEALKSANNKRKIEHARLVASRKAVREHFKNNPATVHIVNREQVEFLVDAWGRDWPYDFVVIDESSSLKDHKTGRFKALKRVRPLIKRMLQLTATPAAETYLHLFAQIYLLDRGERFGKSYNNFRSEFFEYNQYTRVATLRTNADRRIAEKISDITLTLKAEDYLDLTAPVMLIDKVRLGKDQLELYKKMEREFIVTLPSGVEIEAETGAALSQKLMQMASGVVYETVLDEQTNGDFKKRRVVHHLHDYKIEALRVIVEEAQGEPLLVAYWHESSLSRLKSAFPQAVVMDKAGTCIKPWNAKKIPILLVHPQSAGHGLNLQHGGRRIVFFDLYWSLELYSQLIGRLARQGQQLVVMVHHLIAEGTIDEDILTALDIKCDDQERLFRLLKLIRARVIRDNMPYENCSSE